jgi:hypothetical protein
VPTPERHFWVKCVTIWLAITIAADAWLHETRWWFMSLPSAILMLRAGWKWLMTAQKSDT